jgi:hypothetical protein
MTLSHGPMLSNQSCATSSKGPTTARGDTMMRAVVTRTVTLRWPYLVAIAVSAHLGPTIASANPPQQQDCNWRSGELLTVAGSVTAGGLEGGFTRVIATDSGRFSEKRDYGLVSYGSGDDGQHAWSQDVSGGVHVLSSDFASRLARSEAWLNANQNCAKTRGARVEVLAPAVEAGRRFDIRRITPQHGAPIEVWYESASGLPNRAILQYAENRLVRRYEDWRDIGAGRKVPFKEIDEDIEDESSTIFVVHSATVRELQGNSLFRMPAAPHDVRFLGQESASSVSYEDDHRTRIYIPVVLNGRGPFVFELDSGGHFILGQKTVAALGLTPQGAFSSTGAGVQVSKAGYIRLSAVRIGTAEILDQAAKVLPLSDQSNDRGAKPPRAGILGLELFERFFVSIDRTRQTVTLEAPGTTEPGPGWVALPITFDEDAPLVPGSMLGAVGEFMIDTGDAGSTIVEQVWAEQQGVAKSFDSALILGGNVKFALAEVRLGPFRASNEVVSYYGAQRRGSEHTQSVAAVLGELLLSRFDLKFDYAHRRIWMKPVDNRGPVSFNRSGLNLSKLNDGSFSITSVISGSPAADLGVKEGEIIDEVAGQPSRSLSRADVLAIFEQAPGTSIEIAFRSASGQSSQLRTLRLRDVL